MDFPTVPLCKNDFFGTKNFFRSYFPVFFINYEKLLFGRKFIKIVQKNYFFGAKNLENHAKDSDNYKFQDFLLVYCVPPAWCNGQRVRLPTTERPVRSRLRARCKFYLVLLRVEELSPPNFPFILSNAYSLQFHCKVD